MNNSTTASARIEPRMDRHRKTGKWSLRIHHDAIPPEQFGALEVEPNTPEAVMLYEMQAGPSAIKVIREIVMGLERRGPQADYFIGRQSLLADSLRQALADATPPEPEQDDDAVDAIDRLPKTADGFDWEQEATRLEGLLRTVCRAYNCNTTGYFNKAAEAARPQARPSTAYL